MLLDALQHAAVLVQAISTGSNGVIADAASGVSEARTKTMPFPPPRDNGDRAFITVAIHEFIRSICWSDKSDGGRHKWESDIPCLSKLCETVDLRHSCGYVTLLDLDDLTPSPPEEVAAKPHNGNIRSDCEQILKVIN